MKRWTFCFSVSPSPPPPPQPQHLENHHLAVCGGGYWSHTVCISPPLLYSTFSSSSFSTSGFLQYLFSVSEGFLGPPGSFRRFLLERFTDCSFVPFGAAKSPSRKWLEVFDCLCSCDCCLAARRLWVWVPSRALQLPCTCRKIRKSIFLEQPILYFHTSCDQLLDWLCPAPPCQCSGWRRATGVAKWLTFENANLKSCPLSKSFRCQTLFTFSE